MTRDWRASSDIPYDMDVGRPKNNDYPPYMIDDCDRGGFIVTNPITGKRKRFLPGQEPDARDVAILVGQLVAAVRKKEILDASRPIVAGLVDRWRVEKLPLMPWDASTRATAIWRLNRIRAELGTRTIEGADCLALETWLNQTATSADAYNKWRGMLVLLWRFGVAQKIARANEAEKIERRSTSRKIAANRKVRQQLDVEGFRAIWAVAPPWLQVAMDASLVTLQSRREVCGVRHADFRSGFLFVIRDKVAGDSNMAFIKIRLTPELEAIRGRALKLDAIASPYLVHRAPARKQRRWVDGKPHWTSVNEHYLSQAFAAARDTLSRFAELPERQRPTFHEIRGLGARLYQANGTSKAAIQALMTHSSKRTTEIYLERGVQGLTDDDFHTVSAPLSRQELLGG